MISNDNGALKSERDKWRSIQAKQKEQVSTTEGRQALIRLKQLITENESAFFSALKSDLGKSSVETYASEIAVTLNEIDYLLRHMGKLMKDKKVFLRPGLRAYVGRRPYGSVLIMSPWNYPFQLALLPLAGALAAGNNCFLKPSELSPATSRLIAQLVGKYFDSDQVCVVEGDGQTAAELLKLDWDFIFFTGSERIGSIIAMRAAELGIPSILELGGKCPCIVDAASVNEITARRIVWGKFFNAGQTCVAPDYVLVEKSAAGKLIEEMKAQIVSLYGENPSQAADYGRIISNNHFSRLKQMLNSGTIAIGGKTDQNTLYIEPTIILNPEENSILMQEEIFGPILPVITWEDKGHLLSYLVKKSSPLTVYAFCCDQELIHRLSSLRSGAFCLNTVLEHVAQVKLPFGGVGSSGYGRYHGRASIESFSWQKTYYSKSQKKDIRLMYPPYQDKHLSLMRRFRKWLP